MKTILVSLILAASSFAFAESDRPLCTPGTTAEFQTRTYQCDASGNYWIRISGTPIVCTEGRVAFFPVNEYQGDNNVHARAVCRSGKYIFDNDKYNYRPTRGLNRCVEGRIWQEDVDRGNPGITYQCQNGRAVRIR